MATDGKRLSMVLLIRSSPRVDYLVVSKISEISSGEMGFVRV